MKSITELLRYHRGTIRRVQFVIIDENNLADNCKNIYFSYKIISTPKQSKLGKTCGKTRVNYPNRWEFQLFWTNKRK